MELWGVEDRGRDCWAVIIITKASYARRTNLPEEGKRQRTIGRSNCEGQSEKRESWRAKEVSSKK